jgi:hypothetical protein
MRLPPERKVVGDVEDVITLEVGQVPLEQVEVLIEVVDEPERLGHEMDGPDAAGCDGPGAVGDLIVDVGGGHHRLVSFDTGLILDAIENSLTTLPEDSAVSFSVLVALVFSGLARDSSSHPKTSVVWNSEDVFSPQLLQKLRGFSSLLADSCLNDRQITLGWGLDVRFVNP